ncbi:hypothetical protein C9374_003876 [Naegleria lovaniensis]|uniref:BTB domain-containing protein n=1 Tax=Naegleria lovaniensis TaxID=51637 RepID=A0AA88H8N4_NAELO|nr:uncharacterized protein C9374_003876 [Naegleria lovaniensis]KAG2394112.1 hypothetical protein C9374_003876 [Naegleria lovaniensis]
MSFKPPTTFLPIVVKENNVEVKFYSFTKQEELKQGSFEEWRWEYYKQLYQFDFGGFNNNEKPDTSFSWDQSTFGEEQSQENSTIVISPPSTFSKSFFNKKEFSDVTCKFIHGNDQVVDVLHLNKLIICSHSDYFKAMFSEHISMIEAHSNEFIVDAQEDDVRMFKLMMQSVYEMEALNNLSLDVLMDIYLLYDKYGFIGHKTYLIDTIIGKIGHFSNAVAMVSIIFSKFSDISSAIEMLSWRVVQKLICMSRAFWLLGDHNSECLEMFVDQCSLFDFSACLVHEWIYYSVKFKGLPIQNLKAILEKINSKFTSFKTDMKVTHVRCACSDPVYQYILEIIYQIMY